jgi:hypothetical protein
MNIIKHGSLLNKIVERFTCQKCGCVFEADEDEFWVSDSLSNPFWGDTITTNSYTFTVHTERKKFCNCPLCHAKCEKTEIVQNYTDLNKVTYSKDTTGFPPPEIEHIEIGDFPPGPSVTCDSTHDETE